MFEDFFSFSDGEEGNNEKAKKVLGELEIIFNFNIILIFRKWVDFVDGRILDNISKNKGQIRNVNIKEGEYFWKKERNISWTSNEEAY